MVLEVAVEEAFAHRLWTLAVHHPEFGYARNDQMPTCYLSGPMSGLPDFNVHAFEKCSQHLRIAGWNVYSPHENDAEAGVTLEGSTGFEVFNDRLDGFDFKKAMAQDLWQVCMSDAVFVIPGWEYSAGCEIEVSVAHKMGIPVYSILSTRQIGAPPKVEHEFSSKPSSRSSVETVERGGESVSSSGSPESSETVCQEADRLVATDRQDDYGHPLDDFTKVTEAAIALGIDPTSGPHHHALYMVVVKLARETNNPKRDNRVDICGYAKTADLVLAEQKRRAELADEMIEEMHAGEDPTSVLVRMARSEPERFRAEVWPELSSEERETINKKLQAF